MASEKNRSMDRRGDIYSVAAMELLFAVLVILLLSCWIPPSVGESSTCLTVYKEGGAPAVFQSPKCPRWTLLTSDRHRPPSDCHISLHQGRRRSQEDRAFCASNLRIPFLGKTGVKEVSVSIVAVFDGHNGAEASDLASRLLLEYLSLHLYFLLDGIYSRLLTRSTGRLMHDGDNNLSQERFKWTVPAIFDDSFHTEILKESLLRAIEDIDATFSKEALTKSSASGSTATIAVIADGQILAANVGDSKALLCSEKFIPVYVKKGNRSKLNRKRRNKSVNSPINQIANFRLAKFDGRAYYVKELTKDHHPDRVDERIRIEASGGYVEEWAGVPRVNGELAVSRAIGDIPFKNFGVISTPEVTEWQSLTSNDSYLVAASDGIFEELDTQEVCDLLWTEKIRAAIKSELMSVDADSLADCIIKTAFERGSMDNMAVVVLPLQPTVVSAILAEDGYNLEGISTPLSFGQQQIMQEKSPFEQQQTMQEKSGDSLISNDKLSKGAASTSLMPMDYFNKLMSKFNWMLVEKQNKGLGCFYLSEDLNEKMDYVFRAPENYEKDGTFDLKHELPEHLSSDNSGWLLDTHNDPTVCWNFGIHDEGGKDQCTIPELFTKFLGLLDSVPYVDTGLNSSESFGYMHPHFRYILKKRFDRGSYGEVWLAFHWNCSQESDAFNGTHFSSRLHIDSSFCYMSTNSSSSNNHSTSSDQGHDSMFILKRIMVERGNTAYLSGLREKYFGEKFLNIFLSIQGLTGRESLTNCSIEPQFDYVFSQNNMSDIDDLGYILDPTESLSKNVGSFNTCCEEGINHIARYVESFESESREIWLVFRNEGLSLSKLIYKAEETKLITDDETNEQGKIKILRPSPWWQWLRSTEAGKKEMKNLIWQLLLALKSCHDRNITHRDIKPENMIVCFEDVGTGRCLREVPNVEKQHRLRMRIIDFGSAIDEFTEKHLYGSGPTRSEQTYEYTPPEALLNSTWYQGRKSITVRYDMWSVGVVMLELILGTPHVFQISHRTYSLLDQHLHGWSQQTKELAYKLRSYMEMCILVPGISPQWHHSSGIKDHGGVWPASWKCSEESFSQQVKTRDPLKLGFPDVWALRLVRQLLVWHPEDRLSVDDALQHPYFMTRSQARSH